MDCTFKILAYSELSLFRYIQAYSNTLRISNAYLSQTFHIPSPGMLRTKSIFKILLNFDQVYSEPCHSENSLFRHYSAIFRHIQNLVLPSHIQKPGIFGNLEYSEPFHNCIPSSVQNSAIFKKIGKPFATLEIENLGILAILV